jgi:hypothetical protein
MILGQVQNRCVSEFALGAVFLAACSSPMQGNTNGEVLNQPMAGEVDIDISPDGPMIYQQLSASFVNAGSQTCTITVSGPCHYISCPSGRSSISPTNAGTITVSSGSSSVALIPQFGNGGYTTVPGSSTHPFFAPGASINVSASGGPVSAFTASLSGPSAIAIVSPTDDSLQINRSQDFPISWSGTSGGDVIFQIEGLPPENLPSLECLFDGSGSSGTIPAAALGLVPAGDYNAHLFTRSRSIVSAGGWDVLIDARQFASTTGGAAYKPPATLQ